MKPLLDWLADLLAPWFIPREDYDTVQERQANAIWQARLADERADSAIRETHDLLTKSYESYRPLEQYADNAKIREFRHQWPSIPGVTFGWQIRLDEMRFISLRDPKEEAARIKEYAAEELTQNFRRHIREKLFALPTP